MNEPRDRLMFALWLGFVGAVATFVHDYAYRRGGGDDFELGGFVSHAGTDMLIVTGVLIAAALVWIDGRR